MPKPSLSLRLTLASTLASTLVLASCNLTTPNTSAELGGIGQNPCLDSAWQNADYCKGKASVAQSKVAFVASHTLQLEPIPLQLQRSGLPLALVANALSQQALPQGAQVEFFLNGQSLGKVNASELNTQTHTFFDLLQSLKPGQYSANAVLLDPNGQQLAESNTITFNIPEAVHDELPAVALLGPTTQQPLQAGTPVKAIAVARIPQNQPGTTLSFVFNGQTLNATQNPDGTYSFDLNTAGLAPGAYPVDAILKDASGKIISRSAVKQVIIAAPPNAAQPQLQLFNLSGVNTTPQGNPLNLSGLLNLPANLKKTGQTIAFFANGQKIAEGTVDRNGHYALTWQTQAFATGQYQLTAKVFNADGSLVVESNTLPVTLTGAEVAEPAVQLNSLPAQAFPGSVIALTATPNIPSNLDPNTLSVVFTANGQTLGTGTRNPDGSYTIDWNTTGLQHKTYDIEAQLKDASGQTLAVSNIGKIQLTEDTPVDIDLTSGNVSTVPGTRVSLTANIQVSPELLNGGAYVEFRQGNKVIGRGTRQPDGTYTVNFDTTGYAPGDYPVEAVLRSASGQQLAVSNRSTVKLAGVPQNQIILTSTSIQSSVGSSVPLTANVTLAQTTINTQAAAVRFMSNGELLGIGIKQPDGTYRLDWDTNGRNIGQYPIKAILVDANGQALAESLVGVVNLQSAQSNTLNLVNPIQGSVFSFGSNIPLEAAIAITPAQQAAGVTVEFFIDGKTRITALDGGSGKYTATLNQPAVGDHTVRAILKTLGGTVLAESNVHTTRVESASTGGGGGGGGSSSSGTSGNGNGNIGDVNTPANVTRTLDLVRPTDGGGLSLNTPTELQATATLNPQDVADGYKIRFRDPASNFSQDVVPTRPNVNTTSYTASVVLTPTGALGNRPLIAEIVDMGGNVVGTLTDTHTLNVVNTTVNLLAPADNSVVAPASNQTLSGEATNVPLNGTVRFVVKDSTGNILVTLPATNTAGNTWSSATNAWTTPNTTTDVDIEMQVLPPGTENPLVTDTHDVAVVANGINTMLPADQSVLTPGAFSNDVSFTSSVPTLTPEQITNGATVFFDVLDNGGNPINGLSNLQGTQQGNNTWEVNADLSTLAVGNYSVRAKILATSDTSSTVLATDTTPNAFAVATPTVNLQTPADNGILAPSSTLTLSGEATNVPTGGTVRFVVKDAGGNVTATLPASNTSGNTWASATNAWTAPNTTADVTIDMQILPPGAAAPAVNDLHNIAVVNNSVSTATPADNTRLIQGASSNATVLISTVPVMTDRQRSNGATVFFDILDGSNAMVIANIQGTVQGNNTWQTTADLSGLAAGNYKVRAKLLTTSNNTSTALATEGPPNPFALATPTVNLLSPADNSIVAPSSANTLSGEATNVPTGGTVRFVVKDSGGNPIGQPITATNTSGNTWVSATNAWTAPATAQDVTVEMQILPAASSTAFIVDSHSIQVLNTQVSLTQPAENAILTLNSPQTFTGTVTDMPAGGSVRFWVRDNSGTNVAGPFGATNPSGNIWTSASNVWMTPNSIQDLNVVIEVLDTHNQQVKTDSHNIYVVGNSITAASLENAEVVQNETNDISATAVLSQDQIDEGAYVEFTFKDPNNGDAIIQDDLGAPIKATAIHQGGGQFKADDFKFSMVSGNLKIVPTLKAGNGTTLATGPETTVVVVKKAVDVIFILDGGSSPAALYSKVNTELNSFIDEFANYNINVQFALAGTALGSTGHPQIDNTDATAIVQSLTADTTTIKNAIAGFQNIGGTSQDTYSALVETASNLSTGSQEPDNIAPRTVFGRQNQRIQILIVDHHPEQNKGAILGTGTLSPGGYNAARETAVANHLASASKLITYVMAEASSEVYYDGIVTATTGKFIPITLNSSNSFINQQLKAIVRRIAENTSE